jgi:uracil-DNA glycosylase family 4
VAGESASWGGTLVKSFKLPSSVIKPKYDPRKAGARCDKCPRRGSPVVPPVGPPRGARAAWVGQDPGREEAKKLAPFVGPTGGRATKLWVLACEEAGVPVMVRGELWITDAALCPPVTKNEKEARQAMTCCRPRLLRELARLHPDAGILAMGKWALFGLTGMDEGMGKLAGFHKRLYLENMREEAEEAADKAPTVPSLVEEPAF